MNHISNHINKIFFSLFSMVYIGKAFIHLEWMHDVFCYFDSILALHLLFTVMYFKRSTFPYIESTKHPVLPPFSFSESAKYSVFSSVFFHGINKLLRFPLRFLPWNQHITLFSTPFSSMGSTDYSVFFYCINRILRFPFYFLSLHQLQSSVSFWSVNKIFRFSFFLLLHQHNTPFLTLFSFIASKEYLFSHVCFL